MRTNVRETLDIESERKKKSVREGDKKKERQRKHKRTDRHGYADS